MGPGFGRAIGDAIMAGVVLAMVISFSLGALAVWGLPLLWEMIKPIIHAVTA